MPTYYEKSQGIIPQNSIPYRNYYLSVHIELLTLILTAAINVHLFIIYIIYNGRPFPLSPGASDLRGHEAARGRIRGLADRVRKREQGQREQMMFPRELSFPTLYSFDHEALL